MKLLFAHGWGYDNRIWDQLAPLLDLWPQEMDERGYFATPRHAVVEGPCVAVTHSFGTMRVLAMPPRGLVALVAINGFDRFSAVPGRAGVPLRVVDRMLRRFETEPRAVMAEFRRTCGTAEPFGEIDTDLLHADLLRLRDAAPPIPADVPILSLQGGRDPLLPQAMRASTFAGAPVSRMEHAEGGHLLPLEAPQLCAAAVRGLIEAVA